MPDFQKALHVAWARLYFESIGVHGREHLPSSGPVLYLALHRNGIVDGFVHECVLRAPTYMISAQWKKGFRGIFFDGICVVREKDAGDSSKNADALNLCVDHLKKGGELGIFPEGTSALGPRHLPFKTGAARTLAAYLETGGPIAVLPVGLHYERAWAFRSKVELVIGPPLDTALDPELSPNHRMRTLQQRIEKALEGVGINVADEAEQALVERLAYAATLGTDLDYFHALKVFERGIPEDIRQDWKELDESPSGKRALRHQGVPLIPTGPSAIYALAFLLLSPWVPVAVLLNLPPFLAAYWAGDFLKGLPGSPGTAEGPVYLVLSSEDFARFPKGAVLVARTTNPTWTPLFYSAAAVVTESGGPLSHGAVTAREMKIPAVMSVRNCLSRLQNGQRVRVEGTEGRVVLL